MRYILLSSCKGCAAQLLCRRIVPIRIPLSSAAAAASVRRSLAPSMNRTKEDTIYGTADILHWRRSTPPWPTITPTMTPLKRTSSRTGSTLIDWRLRMRWLPRDRRERDTPIHRRRLDGPGVYPGSTIQALRARGVDVRTAYQEGLSGRSDADQLRVRGSDVGERGSQVGNGVIEVGLGAIVGVGERHADDRLDKVMAFV